ncbi:MAG: M24 family metallopeptidase, partial [Candidatus Kapaibacterium sp.]
AMEYSPMAAIPVVSNVDAGTVEWIRSLGPAVVSSADMAQELQAVWSDEQRQENEKTSFLVRSAMMDAMQFLGEKIRRRQRVTEYDVQQNIVRFFEQNSLVTDHDPIVAIAANAANPHYAPSVERHASIGSDQLVLIDMWAKGKSDHSTYVDITWMCHTGRTPSERETSIFTIVRDARNAAFELVCERFRAGIPLYGFEVDDAARRVIDGAGFGSYFIHRTGHNIGQQTHGSGANMDNYETHDDRRVLAGTSFSIEPGIYIPGEIGVRSEISVVIDSEGNVSVPSQPVQEEIVCLG